MNNKNDHVISLKVGSIEILDKYYVPYFKTGGIIINKNIPINSSVLIILIINIGVEEKKFKVAGKVQMISNNKITNIGIAFDNNQANKELKNIIEDILEKRHPNNN